MIAECDIITMLFVKTEVYGMEKGRFDKNKYVADYKRDHYYHMVSMLPPEYKEIVKTRSESLGLSMTQYIKSLVDADCGITPNNVNAPDQ